MNIQELLKKEIVPLEARLKALKTALDALGPEEKPNGRAAVRMPVGRGIGQKIMEFLSSAQEPQKDETIIRHLRESGFKKHKRHSFVAALSSLAKDGSIKRVSPGVYQKV